MPLAQLGQRRIHYVDRKATSSSTQGTDVLPLVMIHGLGSSQNFYMSVIPQISTRRCIALDSYGAGRSKSNGEDLQMTQLVEDVIKLLDYLEIPKAILVGHSMGGPIVLTAAALYPDRIHALIALGPVKPKCDNVDGFQARIASVQEHGMEALADSIPTSATNKNSTSLQRAMIRELILGQDPKSYASHCQIIIDMQPPPNGGLARVKCPVLILAGDEDKSAPLAGCKDILADLGSEQKELVILNGVGHWHCIESPELVADKINAWTATL